MQGGTTVLGLITDPQRATHAAVKDVNGVISSSATLELTKPPPGPVLWTLSQLSRVQPWMLFPVRNKTEVRLDRRNLFSNADISSEQLYLQTMKT